MQGTNYTIRNVAGAACCVVRRCSVASHKHTLQADG